MGEEPYRIPGKPLRSVGLTGKIFPWNPSTQQPVLTHMGASTTYYLACFSKEEDLRATMTRLGITGYTIKQIQDGPEFLSSIPSTYGDDTLHVILDPYLAEDGLRTRWTQVLGRD